MTAYHANTSKLKFNTWSGSLSFCTWWRFISSWSRFWFIEILKYVHQVVESSAPKLGPQWMGPALLTEEGYMESNWERFRLKSSMSYIGAAVDTHFPYFRNSGELLSMLCCSLCIGIINSQHAFLLWTLAGQDAFTIKYCAEPDCSYFWGEMNKKRKLWLAEMGRCRYCLPPSLGDRLRTHCDSSYWGRWKQ